MKLNWDFDLLHHVNSKFHCNSSVEWGFASWVDIPSSTFQNTYVSQTAQKIASFMSLKFKRALEKHGEAMLVLTGHLEDSCEKAITYRETALSLKKKLV